MTSMSGGFLLMGLGLGGVFLTLFIFYFFILGCVAIAKRSSKNGEEA